MINLIIESSTNSAFISINEGKKVIDFKIIEPAQNLSKELLPSLQQLLLKNQLELKDLDYIAVGIGPGAYTGVRVGAIVGKSLAYSLKIPLIGFESPIAFLPDKVGSFTFLLDAKMGQYYLLKGMKNEKGVALTLPGELVDKEKLTPLPESDFLVAPLEGCLFPRLNPPLIAAIAFERFSRPDQQEFKLIYCR